LFQHLGRVTYTEHNPSGVRFHTAEGTVDVEVLARRIVRVTLSAADIEPGPSYIEEREWPGSRWGVTESDATDLTTTRFNVRVDHAALRLALGRRNEEPLIREPATGGMGVERRVDGPPRVRARFEMAGEQHFYGLGQGGQQFDRLGGMRQLWNTQLGHGPGSDMGVPLLVSNKGYALFFDTTADASLAVGRSDGGVKIELTADGGPLRWYFLIGDDVRGVMNEVAELLGRAPMPPKWMLGFLQSTRHFDSTDELLLLPRMLREHKIPCDAIIFLSGYGDYMGCNIAVGRLETDPKLMPDPAAIFGEFHRQHFRTITHEYPVVHPDSPLFAEAERLGYLLEEGYLHRPADVPRPTDNYREGQRFIDFSKPEVGAWWWRQHKHLVDLGVAGWWLDGGEGPSSRCDMHAGPGRLMHNVFDHHRQRAFCDGEAADRPDQRVVLLCRSGGAGMQRYGSATWTGDINNAFATFEPQIPIGLNTAMSGVPWWGTDIGGFFHPTAESPELFARWFQFGALSPLFRLHGWVWREHQPWAHGPEVEAICRAYSELRYRLMPYIYTLAWQAHSTGLPPMRPLVMNYPDDPRVWELGSQYLFGDDLLVAPVTREGARSWPVLLPEGTWYDFWTGQRFQGPGGAGVEAPVDRLPLLVRGGAIIPTAPTAQHTGEQRGDDITLLIYPDGESSFELYDDDGVTNAYRGGTRALTTIRCAVDGDATRVTIEAPVGDTSVVPADRQFSLRVWREQAPTSVRVEGRGELPRVHRGREDRPAWYHAAGYLHVRLPRRESLSVEVR
jgi:alpha-glucosidase (family GH31 glycosyl hydrolase)